MDKFAAMLLDITNTCNIRCRFCINDWNKPRKTTYMDSKMFDKGIELLPLVRRGFLSCSFEPITHPDYINIFKRVPKNTGAYTFIATNLAKELTGEEIEGLSNMNLDSITISLGSLNPELYEELHTGAKFSIFIDNLERLVAVFRQKPDAPKLRFITIAFKQNMDELEYIAKICNEKYLSILHQFRTPFRGTPKRKEWLDKTTISKEDWDVVSGKLAKLPESYNIKFFNPLYGVHLLGGTSRTTSTYFSFRSDGTIVFHERNKERLPIEFREDFNINTISKPYEFFKAGLQKIREKECK